MRSLRRKLVERLPKHRPVSVIISSSALPDQYRWTYIQIQSVCEATPSALIADRDLSIVGA